MSADQSLFASPEFPEPEDLEDLEDDDDGGAKASDGGRARAVLEHVVTAIVEDPSAVEVTTGEGRSGLVLSLRVAPGDMGRVIGKRGRVAQAMRALVRAAAARDGSDATLDILD